MTEGCREEERRMGRHGALMVEPGGRGHDVIFVIDSTSALYYYQSLQFWTI